MITRLNGSLGRLGKSAGVAVDDAAAIIAAMDVTPDAARQTLITQTVTALKDAGIWEQLDALWVMAAHHEQAGRLNWKSPATFTLSAQGVIAFTADQGWQGNGASGYMNTGWIPSTNGANYELNNASFGFYSRTDISAPAPRDMGCRQSAALDRLTHLAINSEESGFGVRHSAHLHMNATIGRAVAGLPTNSLGLFVARRTASNALQIYINGIQRATGSTASSSLPSFPFFIAARNTAGTPDGFVARQYALAFAAAAMSEAEQLAFYNIFQDGYLSAIGAAV